MQLPQASQMTSALAADTAVKSEVAAMAATTPLLKPNRAGCSRLAVNGPFGLFPMNVRHITDRDF